MPFVELRVCSVCDFSAMQLDAHSLRWTINNTPQSIACDTIDYVKIERWTDSNTTTVVSKEGHSIILPALALPDTKDLIVVLSQYEIRVQEV
jgi:catabolite regulation protein CreA